MRIQHKQNQLQAQSSPFDQSSNLQSIEQPGANGSPPELIEQQANIAQSSIARSRPQGRQGKNGRTIGRSRKGLFGPPQQFSPLSTNGGQSPLSPPANNNAPPPAQQQGFNLPLPSPDLANSRQPTPDLAASRQPSPDLASRQPFSNIQTNDLQTNDLQPSSSSGQANKVSAPQAQPNQPNRLRARKVIRKKAKAAASSFLDKNSLPLDGLMSSASESIESRHSSYYSHYIPALPVENSNFGTRLSKSA